MKAHRYAAILVLVASAIWVLTGDFSSVGGAIAQDQDQSAATAAETETDNAAENTQVLQSVGVTAIPQIEHARTIRISGVTEADKMTRLTARENGVVETLPVRQGQRVSAGDVILTLDPEGRDAAVRSAQQVVEQRQAEADARKTLVERGTLPKLQLDQAMSALRLAETDLESKLAELDRLDVTAPYDGVVDSVDVEVGAAVQLGTSVATLIALDPIIGKGEVNEADLPIVSVGDDASIRLVDGSVVDGTIRFISRQADPVTRTFTVEIKAPNAELTIPSGMTTEVILRGPLVQATPVPRSIVTLNDAGDLGVRAVDADDRVVFYPIDIVDDSSGALILGGIPANARIIVVGQNFVADGQLVEPVDADPEALEKLIEEARAGQAVQ